ncbi:uncharacterized protein [Clytia hemisphaerica]|uniref:EGF-like domain-containing protein n=1 Tax=Clytia hemisphaerica TaxID=252671 RepID=A0A7M5XIF1_9CNID|eukprot:TCONS_00027170-protein
MLITLVFVASLLVSQSLAGGPALFAANNAGILTFEVGTPAQAYGPWEYCPYDSVVEAFGVYYVQDQGATGVRLVCKDSKLRAASTFTKVSARSQNSDVCAGDGITGFRAMESSDTGILQMQAFCNGNETKIYEVPLPGGFLSSTTFSANQSCPVGHRICGLSTSVDAAKGLEGVKFSCCAIASDTAGETSETCDFTPAEEYCTWQTDSFNAQFGPSSFKKINFFENVTTYLRKDYGTKNGAQGTPGEFVYFFSDSQSTAFASSSNPVYDPIAAKYFNGSSYGNGATRDPKFTFSFWAGDSDHTQLCFQVYDVATNNVIQEQILFNNLANDQNYYNAYHEESPLDKSWHTVTFPIHAKDSFKFKFEVSLLKTTGFGINNFGLDAFNYVQKSAGDCVSPGCHDNATCTNTTDIVGFSCECLPGFNGTGANVTDGCVEIMPCDDQSLCAVNVSGVLTNNVCNHAGPGNYTCDCASAFWTLSADNSTCVDIDECALNSTFCGSNTTTNCTNMVGNYSCACLPDHTRVSPWDQLYDLNCAVNGGWTEWTAPGVQYECSATCGDAGVYNATRNCTNPTPDTDGAPCVGVAYNETYPCNRFTCPQSCPVWKNCTSCNGTQIFQEGGALNMTLTYFDGLSANDLSWAMEQLSRWNQSVIETICYTAYCNVTSLNSSIALIDVDVTKVQMLSDKTSEAQVAMRNILDCNPDTDGGHNEWLWEIFDKLCEYKAFLPSIHEDMNIKMGMLSAERDRCMGRSTLRSLIEVMYRKW